MGVTKLWQFLDSNGAGDGACSLSDCSGQSWAVDLSAWIVHARTAAAAQKEGGVSPTFLMTKTVFYRALCLLKHGIVPVFVMDGATAPQVKGQAMLQRWKKTHSGQKSDPTDRSRALKANDLCCRLLEALGVKVMTSPGEAEKTCSALNMKGIVDACLCDDSDALLYGALVVYRNLDVKNESVERYRTSALRERLGLCREDLVLMGLLGGCDYGDGVHSLGPKKALDLIHSLNKYSHDTLQRVCGWRENQELQELEVERRELDSIPKSAHCSRCKHPGKRTQHKKSGCERCDSTSDCSDTTSVSCDCGYHSVFNKLQPYFTELDVRSKALQNTSFPDRRLVAEFMEHGETFDFSSVSVALPDCGSLAAQLGLTGPAVMKALVPVLVLMHLNNTLHVPGIQPNRILRDSKQNFVPCYKVSWQHFEFDKWTPEPCNDPEKTPDVKRQEAADPYVLDVPQDLLLNKYPRLVDRHRLSVSARKNKPTKRPPDDHSQGKMTDFFKVKKKLF